MPNTIGGRNYKKAKSGNVRRRSKNPDMQVDTTTGFDYYAVVLKRLGNNRLNIRLDNGTEVQAVIPGRFMKKVWFNTGDYIHVRREGENYYDVLQKLLNEDEKQKAKHVLNKNTENGEHDIFQQNMSDEHDDYGIPSESESESSDDEILEKEGHVDSISKTKISNYTKINAEDIIRKTVNVDKLNRKMQQKDRDVSRRAETDYIEKPLSLVENESTSDSDENTNDSNSQDNSQDKSQDNNDINIDDI